MEPNKNINDVTRPAIDQKVATDFPKYICTSIADQIRQADTKAFGTLGIVGITTGAVLSRLSALKTSLGGINETWLILFAVSAILIIIALKKSVAVVYPRLSRPKPAEQRDKTYFLDIAEYSKEDFVSWGKNVVAEDVVEESYKNAYNLAQIAKKKYAALRHAMFATVTALVWALGILLFS